MGLTSSGRSGELWAMTSFFNPAGFRRRAENFRHFRERLAAPLIAVELSFGGPFELREGDADILIQLRGGDVMWQKERLLNVALAALPPDCRHVAWLDCDVIFERDDWPERAVAMLQSRPLVHLFRRIHFMTRDVSKDLVGVDAGDGFLDSIVAGVELGLDPLTVLSAMTATNNAVYARGVAWAARRELLDRHGFFDTCILGGGDTALFCAVHGRFDYYRDRHVANDAEVAHYQAWAEPFRRDVGGDVGVLAGDIFHLWHGKLGNRRRRERHEGLAPFGFRPGDRHRPCR